MPSSFTSRLKLERQASGENSGTWGNLVNYVLNRVDASVKGYQAVDVAGAANVTLTSNNSTSNTDDSATDDQVHNAILEFTGTLTANINVFTDAVETNYAVFNNTSGSFTLTFGPTGGTGVDIKQGTKTLVYTDGTTMYDITKDLGDIQVTGLTSNGNVSLKTSSTLKLEDDTGGEFVGLKANATTTSYTLTLPPTTGTADQVMSTDGSGNLSFVDVSGGTSWQSDIKTSAFTAVAGEGYWINTTSGAVTVTLPASASVGDTIEISDYARNWGTNNVTINQNSLNFQGETSPNPVYDVDGQSVRIVYSGATQGWIPTSDDDVSDETSQTYSADFLVIAGGGSGVSDQGGGGGAGGYRNSYSTEPSGGGGSSETSLSLTPGTVYTITVGAGGAAPPSESSPNRTGGQGSDSSISGSDITTITSLGGGRAVASDNGDSGGSGAGGSQSGSGGNGTANQGFNGGPGNPTGPEFLGGGGGAGEAGNTDGPGGSGGDGLSSSITGSAVTRGGGGSGWYPPSAIPGGDGGGGGATTPTGNGGTGTANTGGGGGGGAGTAPRFGGAGGSGVVILRMPTASYSSTTTGSPTVDTDGTDTILTFNASGSYTG